jgi:hypothetical protein
MQTKRTQTWGNTRGSNWPNIRTSTIRTNSDHITFIVIATNSSNIIFAIIVADISHIKVTTIGVDNNKLANKCTTANKGTKNTTIDFKTQQRINLWFNWKNSLYHK